MTITVVILTLNEARHIARAIHSVKPIAHSIVVVDSGSTDETVDIARTLGAKIFKHPFITQAKQFNWALQQLPDDTVWVFRLDADEVVSPNLADSLKRQLPEFSPHIAGATIDRRISFLGCPIRWGGLFPVRIIRILRWGHGRSEDRWMDEHIILDGPAGDLRGELLDDNLKPLSWWIDKHNKYASREVVEILDHEYGFLDRAKCIAPQGNAGVKRWAKEKIYSRLPIGIRATIYFFYRYFIRLGFLDGTRGTAFHVLQGFWYRYIVDLKLLEVKTFMRTQNVDVTIAIEEILEIKPHEQQSKN